jgi:hypothetical protein
MNMQNSYLHNMVGKVIELHLPYKSVVAFQYKGKQERALLRADKIIVNGHYVPMVCFLSDSYCKLFDYFIFWKKKNPFSFILADSFPKPLIILR